MIPNSIVSVLQQQISLLQLLPVAVVVPGVLAALCLLLGGLCAASPFRKGTYCCSKLVMFLATLFLLLCFVFYIIFIAIGLALTFAPPVIQQPINMIQGMCVTVPAQLNQVVGDSMATIDRLGSAGGDLTSVRDQLTNLSTMVGAIDSACDNINAIFAGIFGVFLPGLVCVVAIVFAMWVNEMLCCAAGCFKGPPKVGAEQEAGKVAV